MAPAKPSTDAPRQTRRKVVFICLKVEGIEGRKPKILVVCRSHNDVYISKPNGPQTLIFGVAACDPEKAHPLIPGRILTRAGANPRIRYLNKSFRWQYMRKPALRAEQSSAPPDEA